MEKININPVLMWIKDRIGKNKNVIISINGSTGSGKTYAAITLAYQISKMLDTHFSIADNIDFNFGGLLKKTMKEENKKPGTCFVFEEVGAAGGGASSREWQSQANKFFFSFMQTTRHRNQILIFTCPHFSFLEKGARSLVHMQMETAGINFKDKICYLRPYRVQVNSRSGQFYFKYLRIKINGSKLKFKQLEVKYPPHFLVKPYELMKERFTSDLNESIIEKVKKDIPNNKTKYNPKKLRKLVNKNMTHAQIAKVLGVCKKTVERHIKKLEKGAKV